MTEVMQPYIVGARVAADVRESISFRHPLHPAPYDDRELALVVEELGPPPTTLNGHRGVLRRPRGTEFLNYEGELAVIIGRRMKGVSEEDALSYVGGYTCANDVGLHDFRHADRGSMLRVKGQDGFLPLGP